MKFSLLIFKFRSAFHNLVGLKYPLEKRPVLKLSKGSLIYRPVKPEVDLGLGWFTALLVAMKFNMSMSNAVQYKV